MKVAVCDICYYQHEQKLERAKWVHRFKGVGSFDLCDKHQDHLKGKNYAEALEEVMHPRRG